MVTLSPLAKLPIPELTDRLDGPTAFANYARRAEDITVIPYASVAARTAAYAGIAPPRSPAAGTVTYLIDSGSFEFWDGAKWNPIVNPNLPRGILRFGYTWNNWPDGNGYVPSLSSTVAPVPARPVVAPCSTCVTPGARPRRPLPAPSSRTASSPCCRTAPTTRPAPTSRASGPRPPPACGRSG
jgi:hypothetical protein